MNGEIIYNIPEYTGAGVYALTDDDGMQYIGSSLNISQRIKQHDKFLALANNGDSKETYASSKMKIAAKNGVNFTASILWKLPDGGTQYDLWDAERAFILMAGGCEKTYNTKDVPDFRENDLAGLRGWRSCSPSKRRDDIISSFESRIKKRSSPIKSKSGLIKEQDNIMIRPSKEEGAKIRKAAADAGKSVQAYILGILKDNIN